MKHLLPILLISLIFCNINENNLIGSWKVIYYKDDIHKAWDRYDVEPSRTSRMFWHFLSDSTFFCDDDEFSIDNRIYWEADSSIVNFKTNRKIGYDGWRLMYNFKQDTLILSEEVSAGPSRSHSWKFIRIENLKKDSFKPYKPFKRTKSEEEKLKEKKWTKNIILDSVNDCIESGSTKEFCMCLFVKIETEFTWYEWNVQKVSTYNFIERFNRIIIDCPNHNY